MPRVLFINSSEPQCGVYQYGRRLFDLLDGSKLFKIRYCEPKSEEELRNLAMAAAPDICLYNWIDGIGGYLRNAPFAFCKHNATVYHDGWIDPARWGAILFSDPTMPPAERWHSIGRPLPLFNIKPDRDDNRFQRPGPLPWIGINGFLGAWAVLGVRRVIEEFKQAKIRLHLPAATFGDPHGHRAREVDQTCRALATNHPGIEIETSFDFMAQYTLLRWLEKNDINLYMRDLPPAWRGVSSVLDLAIAVHRPIAVNLCVAFRHVHNLNPSICVEHNSLQTIINNGIAPLKPLYSQWDPEVVCAQVERVFAGLIGIAL